MEQHSKILVLLSRKIVLVMYKYISFIIKATYITYERISSMAMPNNLCSPYFAINFLLFFCRALPKHFRIIVYLASEGRKQHIRKNIGLNKIDEVQIVLLTNDLLLPIGFAILSPSLTGSCN